jgi:MFS family permease
VAQAFANGLLLVVGVGAVAGVLVAGPLSDALLRRGRLASRVQVPAVAASVTVVMMIPALVTHSVLTALPYLVIAGFGLSAQNPPIDAARLDIMPSWLWGRAEGIRTFVRAGAQALAPVIFGAVSDYVFGGGASGLRWTFVVMLLPLALSALYLFVAAKRYPKDVATAAAAPPPPASVLAARAAPSRPTAPTGPDTGDAPAAPTVEPPPRTPGPGTRWVGGTRRRRGGSAG